MDVDNLPLILTAAGAAFLLLILLVAWLIFRHRRRLDRILRQHAWDEARDVVIPDGLDGHVHIDRVLITPRGLIALEIKTLHGAIFGSEKMEEWVMLDHGRRHGFRNPIPALEERVTALQGFVGGINVEAYVLIRGAVTFPKGRPERTLLPEDVPEVLEPVSGKVPDGWRALWGKLAGHAEG